MAKFRLNSNSVFTMGGNAIPCVTDISIDTAADDYVAECMGSTSKEHVAGLTDITGSFSGLVEATGATLMNYVQTGDSGAMVLNPAGTTTGQLTLTSTMMTIISFSMTMSTKGLTAYSCNFVLNDLTIGSLP